MKHLALALILSGCGGSSASCDIDRAQMTARLSELRGSRVEWSDRLAKAAQAHADDMARTGNPAHVGADGSSPADRAVAQGWPSRYVGENLSAGEVIRDQATAQASWEHSAAHLRNTLTPGYTHAGMACASSSSGFRMYWVQVLGAASDNGGRS